jgi:predicted nucleotidyltransferase
MLSVAPDRPVAPVALDVLKLVDRVARDVGLDYFVTGAMARDILLYHVFGLETGRATLDVDLAVAVDSWLEFERIKTRLIETGTVTADKKQAHRLFFDAGAAKDIPSISSRSAALNNVRVRSRGRRISPLS